MHHAQATVIILLALMGILILNMEMVHIQVITQEQGQLGAEIVPMDITMGLIVADNLGAITTK
jgi:hypothetical protein